MKTEKIFISLVVATLGRTKELDELLTSLCALTVKDFEIIIVDQNDHDDLDVIVSKYSPFLLLTHLRFDEKNASKARNFGAQYASADWLGFPDDDCRYTLNTLDELKNTIRLHSVELITGAIVDFDNKLLSNTYVRSRKLSLYNVIGRVSEPCFFIKKQTFDDLNGFDPSFGPGSINFAGEGMELGIKAVKHKKRMYFNEEIIVLHPNKMAELGELNYDLHYKYSFANGYSVVRHFKFWAYWYLVKDTILLFPRIILRPKAFKRKFLLTRINGLYDGVILQKAKGRRI